jgi:GntR family transcriptional regulator/MocR family aminotransferase
MPRKISPTIPQIKLDRAISTPLHLQLRDQLMAAIRAGRIPSGAILPSSRLLCRLLGISRNTVVAAYEELIIAGTAEARPRSGMRAVGVPQTPRFELQEILRAAHYPSQFVTIRDSDGTPIRLSF